MAATIQSVANYTPNESLVLNATVMMKIIERTICFLFVFFNSRYDTINLDNSWLRVISITLYLIVPRFSTKHVSEFLGWGLIRMMLLFVKDDLMQLSDDWPNLKKERPNPPQHEDGGGGGKNKIFLRKLSQRISNGFAWSFQNFAEMSSLIFKENCRVFSKSYRSRILKLKYLKGLKWFTFCIYKYLLMPVQFLDTFCFKFDLNSK